MLYFQYIGRNLGWVLVLALTACSGAQVRPDASGGEPPGGEELVAAEPIAVDAVSGDPLTEIDALVEETPDSEGTESALAVTGAVEDVPLVYNRQVQQFIDYFQGRGRERFELWLQRSGAYIPIMERILHEEGLPRNLVYLALIESGFSSHAYSHAAAVGYWQFIESTGKRYGLRIDDWVDERRDPLKATRAAARYLKDLHRRFGDWHLAAAGYNAGEGKISRAIRRYGTENYWQIIKHRGYIKLETKQYVPKLIAAITIAENPERYGFFPNYATPLDRRPVTVSGGADLTRLAYAADVSYAELKRLNPELRRWMTPPGQATYELQVPPTSVEAFAARLAAAPAHLAAPFMQITLERGETLETLAERHKVRLEDLRLLNPELDAKAGSIVLLPLDHDGQRYADIRMRPNYRSYRVRSGDTLSGIAGRYNVSVSALKKANRLHGTQIRIGQKLRVPGKGQVATHTAPRERPRQYRVKRGDTLHEIARRYRLSPKVLARHNNLAGDMLLAGQLLQIP